MDQSLPPVGVHELGKKGHKCSSILKSDILGEEMVCVTKPLSQPGGSGLVEIRKRKSTRPEKLSNLL